MELLDKLFIRLPDGDRCDDRLDPEFDPALAAFNEWLQSGGGRVLIPRPDGRWEKTPTGFYHLFSELFLQVRGRCRFRFLKQEIEIGPGDLLLVPAGMVHEEEITSPDCREFRNLVLMATDRTPSLHLAWCPARDGKLPRIRRRLMLDGNAFYADLLKALPLARSGDSAETDRISRTLAAAALAKARLDLRDRPQPAERVYEPDPSVNPLSRQAKHYLADNFPTRFPDVPEIARAVGCTPNYLSTIFRQDYGMTLKEYLNQLKFDYACSMLESSSFTIPEIAFSCGFSDISYFTRKFRERFGRPPSSYR